MRRLLVLATAVTVSLNLGCDSKFKESSPDGVSGVGLTFDERITGKEKLDKRIEHLIAASAKLKNILNLFKRVTKSGEYELYTPIDFLIDMSEELQDKIPAVEEGRLVRRGRIVVPIKGVSEKCQIVETLLETSGVYDEDFESGETSPAGESINLSLRTCASKGKYIPVAAGHWIRSDLRVEFNESNFKQVYKDLAVEGMMQVQVSETATCSFVSDKKNLFDTVTCENLDVALSKTETAVFSNLMASTGGDVRFETNAEIYGYNEWTGVTQKKATLFVSVPRQGVPTVELKKANEEPQQEAPQEDPEIE